MFSLPCGRLSGRASLLVVSSILAMLTQIVGCRSEPDPIPPSILLYVSDTLRADGLAAYGSPIDTPVTSRLAREGVLYPEVRSPSSWTRPSIASILSGLAPDVHGVETRGDDLPPAVILLSERLREQGYATACITTNPNVGSFFGFDQGYDSFIELYPRRKSGRVWGKEPRARSNVVTRKAIEWIESVEPPFFLFVLTTDPHWPYQPPKRFDRYGGDYEGDVDGADDVRSIFPPSEADQKRIRSLYDGEIAFNDHSLGRIVDYLEKRGLYEDTIIAFTSDHGEEFWEHRRAGHGKTLYEEALRVPLILRSPERLHASQQEAPPGARLVDVAPTLLDLVGLPTPKGLDGQTLVREFAARPSAYARLQLGKREGESLVEYPWKLITGRSILRNTKETDPIHTALYNLETDPDEKVDLSGEYPERVEALLQKLADRAKRNQKRRDEIGERSTDGVPAEIPDDVRDALDALGYIATPEE